MELSRRHALGVLGGASCLILAGRTAWLQVWEGPDIALKALQERQDDDVLQAPRGTITDRYGNILASSIVTYDIVVDQTLINNYTWVVGEKDEKGNTSYVVKGRGAVTAARRLAPILGRDPHELGAELISGQPTYTIGKSTYYILARDIDPDTWRRVRALRISGIGPGRHLRRQYPAGNLAGNVIGTVYEGTNDKGEPQLIGNAGLEQTCNSDLVGTDGSMSVEIGSFGEVIPTGERHNVPAIPGHTIRTTLDSNLQAVAQRAIDEVVAAQGAQWGCVVAMEPDTGKILVLADSNSVDPSNPGASAEEDRFARTVQAIYEPGSVGKVVTFAAALNEGVITPSSEFTVPYQWTAPNGQSFRDSHPHPTEVMDAAEILKQSSNVGTVQIGDLVSDAVRERYMRDFGWGVSTGIELPAESPGLLSASSLWDGRTHYTTMFGQGVAVTPIQATAVLATVANKGLRVPPRIIDAIIDNDGKEKPTPAPEAVRVMTEETAATLTDMLVGVTQEGGTATEAAINGYEVAGKTGTTEILEDGTTVASFAGFLPAHDPKIAVTVIVNKPVDVFGGVVAAPVFREIALASMHALGVPPDPTIVGNQDDDES